MLFRLLAISTLFVAFIAMSDRVFAQGRCAGQSADKPQESVYAAPIGPLKNAEGPLVSAEVMVGPFDIHRKYRSMEGPFVNQDFKVADLLNSEKILVPESRVYFTEDNAHVASMNGGAPSMFGQDPALSHGTNNGDPIGLVHRIDRKRQLYWFKGIKLEVIDENDNVMPTAEFICHFNLDISVSTRNQLFSSGERTNNPRLISLTQGETQFYFPDGYGVPVASDELWRFGFQAANRKSDEHRRLRQRCFVYFIKDSDLKKPITALNWYVPYCTVVVDGETKKAAEQEHIMSPTCMPTVEGVLAPNRGAQLALSTDSLGRRLSGHWVVPPGEHTYETPIIDERDPNFAAKDRRIICAWTHIHPLCTSTALIECDGASRKSLYTSNITTKTNGGLEIMSIQPVVSPAGIILHAGKHYELQGTYNNTTGQAQDSMVSHGIFFADDTFRRPDWVVNLVDEGQNEKQAPTATSTVTTTKTKTKTSTSEPLFNPDTDGPLLLTNKYLELNTSAGRIHLVLEPELAPVHATQIYKLMKLGAYNGTAVFNYHPNLFVQLGAADYKATGMPPLSESLKMILRRLPLEVKSQAHLRVLQEPYALSMARNENVKDSAVSSFCIMLNSAKQLANKFTIFGHVLPDEATEATLKCIDQEWPIRHTWIQSVQEMEAPVKKVGFAQ